jgi:hypothetical protein
MADNTNRGASKDRLLAMATDYESRSRSAADSQPDEAIIELSLADADEVLTSTIKTGRSRLAPCRPIARTERD